MPAPPLGPGFTCRPVAAVAAVAAAAPLEAAAAVEGAAPLEAVVVPLEASTACKFRSTMGRGQNSVEEDKPGSVRAQLRLS